MTSARIHSTAPAPRDGFDGSAGWPRLPRWLTVASGLVGSVFGVATNLYSAEFRRAIENLGSEFNPTVLSVVIAAVVASGSTALTYRWFLRRRPDAIVARNILIGADALDPGFNEHDPVVGRVLHYLEVERDSTDLVVFLHGIGLDGDDFRPYMAESRFHCIALTLYGLNAEDRDDEHYRPISLRSHVQLLGYALRKLQRLHPGKRITLVGFSFGADMIFFLTQFAPDLLRDLRVRKAVLLDPNVNSSTTTISAKIARVNKDRPLEQLVQILESATTVSEFRYLSEYLYKITSKDFDQVQRFASEVVGMWEGTSYDRCLNYMGQLTAATEGAHFILSFHYEWLFNAIAREAVARGLDPNNFECSRCDHFELISAAFLKDRLEGIL